MATFALTTNNSQGILITNGSITVSWTLSNITVTGSAAFDLLGGAELLDPANLNQTKNTPFSIEYFEIILTLDASDNGGGTFNYDDAYVQIKGNARATSYKPPGSSTAILLQSGNMTGLVTLPSVSISSPAANFKVYGANPVVDLAGTASDDAGLGIVECYVNGMAGNPIQIDQSAELPINTISWTAEVDLSQYGQVGSNIITVVAVDLTGNQTTVSRQFIWIETNVAVVAVNPANSGTIKGIKNHQSLQVGNGYIVSAAPANNNWIFSDWTDGAGNILSSNSSFEYFDENDPLTSSSPPTLIANFAANPFLTEQGTFNGLYLVSNNVTEASSGFFTLNLTASGAFTGKIMTSAATYSLPTTAKFGLGGQVEFVIPAKQNNLIFNLQLDINDPNSQQITGKVSAGNWVAELTADRLVFNATANKAVNYEGRYTMALAGGDDAAASPAGYGCATLSISSAGLIAVSGNLADGTAISQSVSVSKDGHWPFYASYAAPPAGDGGSVFGWITFSNEPASVLGGTLHWFRPAGKTPALYQTGFSNTASVIGSSYNPNDKPLLVDTNRQVTLDGGNLPSPVTNQITLQANDTIAIPHAAENTNKLTLTITKTTGAIGGSFVNPANSKDTIKVNGVLLQNQNTAAGYFLGTNQSGAFLLENP